jgi:pimeloyl-ACP methyl ester carboxylesterase
MTKMGTQFAEAGGIRFAYRRFGRRGGTPLLLLGYFTANLDRSDDPMETNAFAAGREVILVDYPGNGGSFGETTLDFRRYQPREREKASHLNGAVHPRRQLVLVDGGSSCSAL